MRLRYTGPSPTVFAYHGVALVDPGDEFWVDDRDAASFLARADVEEAPESNPEVREAPAGEAPTPRTKARKTPAPAPAGDETPDATAQSD